MSGLETVWKISIGFSHSFLSRLSVLLPPERGMVVQNGWTATSHICQHHVPPSSLWATTLRLPTSEVNINDRLITIRRSVALGAGFIFTLTCTESVALASKIPRLKFNWAFISYNEPTLRDLKDPQTNSWCQIPQKTLVCLLDQAGSSVCSWLG